MSIIKNLDRRTINTVEDSQSVTNIVEFFSRPARKKIAEKLCYVLQEEQRKNNDMGVGPKKRGRPPVTGGSILASLLGVSRKSVGRWLAGDMQSSNVNAGRLLDLALLYDPETLKEVLFWDLERHRVEVESFFRVHGGVLCLQTREENTQPGQPKPMET